VKGRAEPVEIYEVLWKGNTDDLTGVMPIDKLAIGDTMLQLRHCGQEFKLKPEDTPFVIGRDLECDLTINGTMVSRQHAVIEYRRNKFVLRDQSTNGIYIRLQQGLAYYIRREETPLTAEGEISLGKLVDDRPALNIFYKVV